MPPPLIPPGAQIAGYEVVGPLGAGGTGEVYTARDPRLGREVALKVLPAAFAADPDRLARFEREARLLASLNHPNIAHVYGFQAAPLPDGTTAHVLAMELVPGEDLARRLERGPLPVDDVVAIGRQIAEAMEWAHDHDLVHRDLKPANVRMRPDGVVKVLDFGLARAMAGSSASGSDVGGAATADATVTSPALTQMGVLLGTAAYMAPEQARGRQIDRRVDIWAFGCILYELLTASRPFAGETVTDTIAAIVSQEPDWSALPPDTPPAVLTVLRRCLIKDPRRRLRDMGEARLMLEDPVPAVAAPIAVPAAPGSGASSSSPWLRPGFVLGVLGIVGVVSIALVTMLTGDGGAGSGNPVHPTVAQFDVMAPSGSTLSVVVRPAISLSADGGTLAFAATAAGISHIYVRRLDQIEARAVGGSDGGISPSLSPDGRSIVFYADDGTLRKAAIDGQAVTIARGPDIRGIAWGEGGSLIFPPDASGPLARIAGDGGNQTAISKLSPGERTHRWPDVLPGGKAAIFTAGTQDSPDDYDRAVIKAVRLETGEESVVIEGAAMARYCGRGVLVYAKGPSLFAVGFDPERLVTRGNPSQVVPWVVRDASTGATHFACAGDVLAYVPGSAGGETRRLVWADQGGRQEALPLAAGTYQEAMISPDGTRIALLQGASGHGDVWVYDVATQAFQRLTFNGTSTTPTWSPDGRFVYYTSFADGGATSTITRKPADGSGEAETLRDVKGRAYLGWVDRAQSSGVLHVVDPSSDRGDIMRVAFDGRSEPVPLSATSFNEYGAAVSPNGRWLAFNSDETGRPEVYVVELERPSVRRQVTRTGGEEPHWSGSGRELFYRQGNRMMAVSVGSSQAFEFGAARPLFDGTYTSGIESGRSYDADPTQPRFLLMLPDSSSSGAAAVRVVVNWNPLGRDGRPDRP